MAADSRVLVTEDAHVQIKIHRKVIGQMILHALEEDPQECCGVLLGSGDEASRLVRIRNVAGDPERRYSMDPMEQQDAEQQADEAGEMITAIYHSHTYTQAHPSVIDVRNAVNSMWTGPFYVLVSLVEKTRPIVRAFRIEDSGEVNEVVIVTDGRAYRS